MTRGSFRWTRSTMLALVGAFVAVLVASSAPAAPAGADLDIEIGVSEGATRDFPFVPNGGTKTVTRRSFVAGFLVRVANLEPGAAKIRFRLADGLSWGDDGPEAAQSCTDLGSAAECSIPTLPPGGGTGVGWDVVAAQTGTYRLDAEIVETSTADPNPSNNSASVTVVVTEAAGGGSAGGGGEGSAAVSASAVTLAPAKPKAGSAVAATVRVRAGGLHVRPSRVACAGTIAGVNLRGTPRAGSGTATCTYRTPRSASGMALRGTVSFNARGQRFAKRFSIRLG